MPKVGFGSDDIVSTGLNFGEGWGLITEATAIVHQFPPNKQTNEQSLPATMVALTIQRTDTNGAPTTDEPIIEYFGCGSLEKFHPGVAENADDKNPDDCGIDLGAEGNCLWSNGDKINARSKWAIFSNSVEKAGFNKEILNKGFLQDLVGMIAFFVSKALPKDADRTYTRDPKALEVSQISVKPYEKSKGKAKAKPVAAAAAAPAAVAAAPVATAAVAAPAPVAQAAAPVAVVAAGDAEGMAKAVIGKLIAANRKTGEEVVTLPAASIKGKLVSIFARGIGAGTIKTADQKLANVFIEDPAWLETQLGELGVGLDEGNLIIPPLEAAA